MSICDDANLTNMFMSLKVLMLCHYFRAVDYFHKIQGLSDVYTSIYQQKYLNLTGFKKL
jgi:hypothetical protein